VDLKGSVVKVFLVKHDLVGQFSWAEHVKAKRAGFFFEAPISVSEEKWHEFVHTTFCYVEGGDDCELIPFCYQDETKYGMLRVVTDDRSERWQDLDR
jgi:hypothetical protein